MVISSIFCHDITGYGGRGTQHDEDRHQFLVPVAEADSEREEQGSKEDQLDHRGDDGRFYLLEGFSALEPGADGDQCERCGSGADAADGFIQKGRQP